MKKEEKELMDRYIYDVIRRIPKDQREDIRMELAGLIGDMYDDSSSDNMEEILQRLGNPAEFAKQYRDESKYLISPEYFDDYKWVLEIVLAALLLSAVLSLGVQVFTNSHSFGHLFGEAVSSLMIGGLAAFGAVTLIFAILERQKVRIDFKSVWTIDKLPKGSKGYNLNDWNPLQLPTLPDKKALISRGDCIGSIIFILLFAIFLIFFPSFVVIGINTRNGESINIISIFNMNYWHIILPLLLLSFGLCLATEIYKLFAGRYCIRVMAVDIFSETLQVVIGFILLKCVPFFNPDFVKNLEELSGLKITSNLDLLKYWNTPLLTNIILAIIVITSLIEVGIVVYKTIRYGIEK